MLVWCTLSSLLWVCGTISVGFFFATILMILVFPKKGARLILIFCFSIGKENPALQFGHSSSFSFYSANALLSFIIFEKWWKNRLKIRLLCFQKLQQLPREKSRTIFFPLPYAKTECGMCFFRHFSRATNARENVSFFPSILSFPGKKIFREEEKLPEAGST